MLSKLIKFILNIIFPINCLGDCGKFDIWLCDKCIKKIDAKNNYICLPDSNLTGLFYAESYQNELISKLIYYFKYKYIEELANPLGKIMFQALGSNLKFDLIAFVPLHKKKELIRCFNQTYLLAKYVSKETSVPIVRGILNRKINTQAQAQLDEQSRKINIKNAFICKNKKAVLNKTVLLVDDVYTTGSTMNECAKVLNKAGAKQIYGIVIAKGEASPNKRN